MKNICFVNTTPFWGGGEKWHTENAIAMTERGFNVHFILNSKGEIKKRLENTKIDFLQMNLGSLSFLNFFTNKQIANYLVSKKIDTVIINDSRDLKTVGLVAKKIGLKRVVYRRGIALPVKPTKFNQFIYSELVSHFIFNSLETRKQFFKNLDEDKIKGKKYQIYNGLEVKDYRQKSKENERTIIGNASRLTDQKGIEYLIELAKKLKENSVNAEIRVAGKGELQGKFEQEISKNQLQNYFKLVGFYEDVHDFLSEIDIYICSSKFEGFGFSIAEAMLHRLPVIGFDISSNPEIIDNNITGYLVAPFDIDELYNKTLELINSPELRNKLGLKGLEKAINQFERQKSFDILADYIIH